jgi:hypothetical protein
VKRKREASLPTAESMAPALGARGCGTHASVRTRGMRGRTWLSSHAFVLVAAMAICGTRGSERRVLSAENTFYLQRTHSSHMAMAIFGTRGSSTDVRAPETGAKGITHILALCNTQLQATAVPCLCPSRALATVPRAHAPWLQRSSTTNSCDAQRQGIAGIAGNWVLPPVTRHDLAPVPRTQKKVLPGCVCVGGWGEGVLPLRLRGGVRMLDAPGGGRGGVGMGGKSRAAGGGGRGRGGERVEGEAEGAARNKKTVRGKDGFKVCMCVCVCVCVCACARLTSLETPKSYKEGKKIHAQGISTAHAVLREKPYPLKPTTKPNTLNRKKKRHPCTRTCGNTTSLADPMNSLVAPKIAG